MSVIEAINVREILFSISAFGPEEIEQLETAVTSEQAQDVRQYLTELQKKLESGSPSTRDLLAAGVTSYLLAQHVAANEYLSKLSDDGLAEYYQAKALLALERWEEAEKTFKQAGRHGRDLVQCTLEAAGAIRLSGRIDEAEELLRSTGREGATRAEYSYQMGCILADRDDTYGAIEYFERAVDMDSHHSGALFRLASLHSLLGNDHEAIKLYEQSLSRPPMYLGALINLGLLYEDIENYSAAAYCFTRILEAHPNHERARLYFKDIDASGDMYYDEDAIRRGRELDHVMQIPITDFELSARSRNCLEGSGIRTLGDLTQVGEQELLAGKNFGETSLREIREILESRGLRIGQSVLAEKRPTMLYHRDDLSPEERTLMETPVTGLNLSVRARKCLARLGITSVGELVCKSADELLSVRNFGVTSLNEVRSKLAELDTSLRND